MLYFVACFFTGIFQCTPRAKIWNPEIPGRCVDYKSFTVVTSVFNLVSDFLMLLFPLICTRRLQMSSKRKLGLSAIFSIGSL